MPRIMIVDDSLYMREALKKMLEGHGYDVLAEAEDGAEGVELYKKFKPDIVTMDITMSNMSGIEALGNILEFDANAKVVMVSAMGQRDMIADAVMKGAYSYIIKPIKKEELLKVLDESSK